MLLFSVLACIELPLDGSPPAFPNSAEPAPLSSIQVDTWAQHCTESLDLLVAADPALDPTVLVEAVPHLMDVIAGTGIDVRVGLLDVSADATEPAVFVDATDGQAVLQLFGTFTGPTGTAPALFDRTFVALDGTGATREDADLLVVGWLASLDSSVVTPTEFVTWLDGVAAGPAHTTFWGIGPVDVQAQLADAALESGGDVLAPSDSALSVPGTAALSISGEVPLSRVPVAGTIGVEVYADDGVQFAFAEDLDWSFDAVRNQVSFFEYRPGCGDEVTVSYEVTP